MSTYFDLALLRLKYHLRVSKDQEVADALGLSRPAFSERKRRNSFPVKDLCALAQRRPELGIDVDYVLTGIPTKAASLSPTGISTEEAKFRQQHTLNRIVPAMASGFTVQTSCGDLAIEPGPLAEYLRAVVALDAQRELDCLGGPAA